MMTVMERDTMQAIQNMADTLDMLAKLIAHQNEILIEMVERAEK